MRRADVVSTDRFEQIVDRDIEVIIAGGTPANTDLLQLRPFVASLRSLAGSPVPADFIAFHSAESAAAVERRRAERSASSSPNGVEPLFFRVRRRVTAAGAGIAMLLATTGMAWAADGAVPGDWNYGLDRALEAVGIGAGGQAERLAEQATLHSRMPAPSTERSSASIQPDDGTIGTAPEFDAGSAVKSAPTDGQWTPPGQAKDKNTPPGQTKDKNTPPGQTKDKGGKDSG